VQGTYGAAFREDFDRRHVSQVFYKGTDPEIDSYSAFFDNARRRATGLGDYLVASGIRDVTVLGLATDYCVRATTLDGIWLGFRMTVVEDGCRAVELQSGDGERAMQEMSTAGATIIRSVKALLDPD
jgi:nicotinamidase/pyrazinamidase